MCVWKRSWYIYIDYSMIWCRTMSLILVSDHLYSAILPRSIFAIRSAAAVRAAAAAATDHRHLHQQPVCISDVIDAWLRIHRTYCRGHTKTFGWWHIDTHTHIHLHTHTYRHPHTPKHTHTHISTHTYTHTSTDTPTHRSTKTHTYTYTPTHARAHTHTHSYRTTGKYRGHYSHLCFILNAHSQRRT